MMHDPVLEDWISMLVPDEQQWGDAPMNKKRASYGVTLLPPSGAPVRHCEGANVVFNEQVAYDNQPPSKGSVQPRVKVQCPDANDGCSSKSDSEEAGLSGEHFMQASQRRKRRTKSARSQPSDDCCSDEDAYGAKGPISHSTVEKQRRDRLNLLIEDLAQQVPPADSKYKSDGTATVRRPKHIILSDTLNLLTLLKDKLKSYDYMVKPEPEAMDQFQGSCENARGLQAAGSLPSLQLPLPIGSTRLMSGMGVLVEMGLDSIWRINVHCRDRKGLLADIFDALRLMPLSILAASVVTSPEGVVQNVLEVKVEHPDLTPEDIEFSLNSTLATIYGQHPDAGAGGGAGSLEEQYVAGGEQQAKRARM
eukprot:gene27351-4651_t